MKTLSHPRQRAISKPPISLWHIETLRTNQLWKIAAAGILLGQSALAPNADAGMGGEPKHTSRLVRLITSIIKRTTD
jgi:hypothetical protein